MTVKKEELGLFDDPTYDELYSWVEDFVDGQGDKAADEIMDAIQLAYNEDRISQPAYTELMDALTPYIEAGED